MHFIVFTHPTKLRKHCASLCQVLSANIFISSLHSGFLYCSYYLLGSVNHLLQLLYFPLSIHYVHLHICCKIIFIFNVITRVTGMFASQTIPPTSLVIHVSSHCGSPMDTGMADRRKCHKGDSGVAKFSEHVIIKIAECCIPYFQ